MLVCYGIDAEISASEEGTAENAAFAPPDFRGYAGGRNHQEYGQQNAQYVRGGPGRRHLQIVDQVVGIVGVVAVVSHVDHTHGSQNKEQTLLFRQA